MSDPLQGLPAGEAREDEREIERAADRLQNTEPQPMRMREAAVVPMTAPAEDGTSKLILAPDGTPAAMRGQVITTLAAEEARHEELRRIKPCISCANAYQPQQKSDEWHNRAAHVSMMKRLSVIHPLEGEVEYFGCRAAEILGVRWVHASQTCPVGKPFMHSYKKGWLASVKAWLARRAAMKVVPS